LNQFTPIKLIRLVHSFEGHSEKIFGTKNLRLETTKKLGVGTREEILLENIRPELKSL
jgi:hypothetical protein